jgi:RimJ/RimL family protein N-acetyltransferase
MIETNRLYIKPLNYEQLRSYSKDKSALDEAYGLNDSSGYVSEALKEAIETTMLPALAKAETNYLYTTLWVVIWKEENKIIGGISFTGAPDAKGAIEIGYGCYEDFRKKGFMKEAVKGMLHWAATQSDIKSVTACCSKDNIASYKILDENKFLIIDNSDDLINWKYEIKHA